MTCAATSSEVQPYNRIEACILYYVIRQHCSSTYIDVTDRIAWPVTVTSPAKTAELIEIPFGLWTRVGPKKHVLHGGVTLVLSGEYD